MIYHRSEVFGCNAVNSFSQSVWVPAIWPLCGKCYSLSIELFSHSNNFQDFICMSSPRYSIWMSCKPAHVVPEKLFHIPYWLQKMHYDILVVAKKYLFHPEKVVLIRPQKSSWIVNVLHFVIKFTYHCFLICFTSVHDGSLESLLCLRRAFRNFCFSLLYGLYSYLHYPYGDVKMEQLILLS